MKKLPFMVRKSYFGCIFYAHLGKPEEESAWLSLPVATGPICQFPDNIIAPQCPEAREGQTGHWTRAQWPRWAPKNP